MVGVMTRASGGLTRADAGKKPLHKVGRIVLALISLVIIIVVVIGCLIEASSTSYYPTSKPILSTARPDPETDGITWTLPAGASDLRLSLPASLDDIFANNNTGLVGYGLHAGEHIEGLNHVWINLPYGTPVKSWADGVVTRVAISGDVASGEIQITIDYGHNLTGTHMEIKTALVHQGEKVSRGQPVGISMSDDGGLTSSAEFTLVDLGRRDGTIDAGATTPSTVSPFDYLVQSEKLALVEAYEKNYMDPYLQGQFCSRSIPSLSAISNQPAFLTP